MGGELVLHDRAAKVDVVYIYVKLILIKSFKNMP